MEQTQTYPNFRWFVLLALLVVTAASTILMIAPAPLMGEISKELSIDPGKATGIIMGLWNILGATSCLVAGFLVDKYGVNKLMIIGCVIFIVPTLLFPMAGNNLGLIILLRAIQACGVGPVTSILGSLAAAWFPASQRGTVAGLQGVATSGGVLIGFLVSPSTFAHTHSWTVTMGWMTIAPVIALILCAAIPFGPKPPAFHDDLSAEAQAVAQGAFAKALRTPTTWLLIACVFISCWFFTGTNDLTPGYIAIAPPTGLGYGPMMAGKLMGLYQIFFMLGGLLVGLIFEKLFHESARATIGIGFVVSACLIASIMLPVIAGKPSNLSIILPICGFFAAWVMPTAVAFISINYHHTIIGRITGLAFGIGLYAGIPGIIVGSMVLSKTGNYHGSITIVTCVAILGAILSQFLRPLVQKSKAKSPALEA
ncbi:MFS transporter [Holophaga foetida]|uniref:MFS transporter n=1 Tax=Holophaga foetida TaxID=35839 RepID=UPI0002474CF7|nr:MFS transporter [Holophaga foetida]